MSFGHVTGKLLLPVKEGGSPLDNLGQSFGITTQLARTGANVHVVSDPKDKDYDPNVAVFKCGGGTDLIKFADAVVEIRKITQIDVRTHFNFVNITVDETTRPEDIIIKVKKKLKIAS